MSMLYIFDDINLTYGDASMVGHKKVAHINIITIFSLLI